MNTEKIAIVSGIRTPFIKSGYYFKDLPSIEIARIVIRELIDRLNFDPSKIDEVILGCVIPAIAEPNISRSAALRAGIPEKSTAYTIQKNCASSIEAVTSAVEKIKAGKSKVIIAGGIENMSHIPLIFNEEFENWHKKLSKSTSILKKITHYLKFKPRFLKPIDGYYEGTHEALTGLSLGDTADKIARKFNIGRTEQDKFALDSLTKNKKAVAAGKFTNEIMTVFAPPEFEAFNKDENFRNQISLQNLKNFTPFADALSPLIRGIKVRRAAGGFGTVTAGNSAQLADGGCVLLLMPYEKAIADGYTPLGIIEDYAYVGLNPEIMGLGPVFAIQKLLQNSGLKLKDFAHFEINEAFAAQVLACLTAISSKEFADINFNFGDKIGEIPLDKLNPNGGAIALGNPVAATGSRLILTSLLELKRTKQERSLVSLCVGGGQGAAVSLKSI